MQDDSIYSLGVRSLGPLLWIVGVLAFAFLAVMFFDSLRRKRRRREARAKLRGESEPRSNPVSRTFYRTRHSLRKVKETIARDRRTRAIRSRVRHR